MKLLTVYVVMLFSTYDAKPYSVHDSLDKCERRRASIVSELASRYDSMRCVEFVEVSDTP